MLFALFTAFASIPAGSLETIEAANAWHGDRIGYAGEHTEVRESWEALAAEATDAELIELVNTHASPAVRYGALKALQSRDAAFPNGLQRDRDPVEVCPGGCMCMQSSVGELAETATPTNDE